MPERPRPREILPAAKIKAIMDEAYKLRNQGPHSLLFRPSVFQAMKNIGIKSNDPDFQEIGRAVFAESAKKKKLQKSAEPTKTGVPTLREKIGEEAWQAMISDAKQKERSHPLSAVTPADDNEEWPLEDEKAA